MRWHVVGVLLLGLLLPLPLLWVMGLLPSVGSRPPVPQVADCEDTIDYDIKSHYRIVFEELGVPIDSLTSIFQIFRSLVLALYGVYPAANCEPRLT